MPAPEGKRPAPPEAAAPPAPANTPEQAYVAAVLSEVRWKRAHPDIARELNDHMADQRAAFAQSGMPPAEVSLAAVREMGEAEMVGQRMDAAYRPRTPGRMLLLVAILYAGGLALQLACRESFFIPHDLIGWLLAAACFAGAYFFGGAWVARFAWPACGAVLLYAFFASGWFLWSELFHVGFSLRIPINGWRYIQLAAPMASMLLIVRMRGKGVRGVLCCALAAGLPLTACLAGYKYAAFLAGYLPSLIVLLYAIRKGHFGKGRGMQRLVALLPVALCVFFYVFHPGSWGLRESGQYFWTGMLHNLDPAANEFAAMRASLLSGARTLGQGALDLSIYPDYFFEYLSDTDHLLLYVIWRFGYLPALLICALAAFTAVFGFARVRRLSPSAQLIARMILVLYSLQGAVYILCNLGVSLYDAQLPLPVLGYGHVSLVLYMGMLGLLLSLFRTDGLHETLPSPGAHIPLRA